MGPIYHFALIWFAGVARQAKLATLEHVIVITPAYLGSSPGARHSWCTQEEVLLSIRSWSFSIWKPRRLSQGLQTVASLRFLSIKNRHTLHYLSHRPCLGLALDSLRSFGLRQICMDGIGEYQHHAGAQHPVIRFTAFSLGMMALGVLLANRHLITERGRSFRGLQFATTFVPMRRGISRLPFAELLQVASSGIVTQKPRCKEAVSTTIIHHSSLLAIAFPCGYQRSPAITSRILHSLSSVSTPWPIITAAKQAVLPDSRIPGWMNLVRLKLSFALVILSLLYFFLVIRWLISFDPIVDFLPFLLASQLWQPASSTVNHMLRGLVLVQVTTPSLLYLGPAIKTPRISHTIFLILKWLLEIIDRDGLPHQR